MKAVESTWWVNPAELDEDQKLVIAAPLGQSHLIVGPPGSGKSNLLLLRANYLELAGKPNLLILVFTRHLQEFMVSGASNYSFPPNKILTSRSWSLAILREYDVQLDLSQDFRTSRSQLIDGLSNLIDSKKLRNIYEYILLDEVQDYLPEEIGIFCKLSRHIYAVGDLNQKIYSGSDVFSRLETVVDNVYKLRFHYRNGLKICQVADGVAKQTENYRTMTSTSNYDEKGVPSSVDVLKCDSLVEQCKAIEDKLALQLKAYPGELIGIMTPRHQELQAVADYFRSTPLYSQGLIQIRDDGQTGLDMLIPIVLCTLHSAKGLEFRAVHICAFEYVKKFPKQRNICFTGITRAKTALYLYHEEGLPGYLEQAVVNMERPRALPHIEDLFIKE